MLGIFNSNMEEQPSKKTVCMSKYGPLLKFQISCRIFQKANYQLHFICDMPEDAHISSIQATNYDIQYNPLNTTEQPNCLQYFKHTLMELITRQNNYNTLCMRISRTRDVLKLKILVEYVMLCNEPLDKYKEYYCARQAKVKELQNIVSNLPQANLYTPYHSEENVVSLFTSSTTTVLAADQLRRLQGYLNKDAVYWCFSYVPTDNKKFFAVTACDQQMLSQKIDITRCSGLSNIDLLSLFDISSPELEYLKLDVGHTLQYSKGSHKLDYLIMTAANKWTIYSELTFGCPTMKFILDHEIMKEASSHLDRNGMWMINNDNQDDQQLYDMLRNNVNNSNGIKKKTLKYLLSNSHIEKIY